MAELGTIRAVFDRLDEAEVDYCHWKSNEHLGAALAGETDLDILVDPSREADCRALLREHDFKCFEAPPWAKYSGIFDYVGVDEATGKLIHLHWHHELSVGRHGVKAYHLPWERYVLDTRVRAEEFAFFVADPAVELLLLLVRAILKSGDVPAALARDLDREYQWLREQVSAPRLVEVVAELLGAGAVPCITPLLKRAPTVADFTAVRDAAQPPLESYNRYSVAGRAVSQWSYAVASQTARVRHRVFGQPIPRRRVNPDGGLLVAILGSDGSGKSTVLENIARWLSWKLDVYPMYMGTPKLLTRVLRWATGPARLLASAVRPQQQTAAPRRRGLLRSLARAVWATAVALDKRRQLRRAARAQARGLIVVCDRYPQAQTVNFNDGPLLDAWRDEGSRLARLLANWEHDVYSGNDALAPDLVVKLNVTPDVAVSRRDDDMNLEVIRRKVESIRALRFPASTRVVDIDADQPLEQVLLQVRHAIWQEV